MNARNANECNHRALTWHCLKDQARNLQRLWLAVGVASAIVLFVGNAEIGLKLSVIALGFCIPLGLIAISLPGDIRRHRINMALVVTAYGFYRSTEDAPKSFETWKEGILYQLGADLFCCEYGKDTYATVLVLRYYVQGFYGRLAELVGRDKNEMVNVYQLVKDFERSRK